MPSLIITFLSAKRKMYKHSFRQLDVITCKLNQNNLSHLKQAIIVKLQGLFFSQKSNLIYSTKSNCLRLHKNPLIHWFHEILVTLSNKIIYSKNLNKGGNLILNSEEKENDNASKQ